MFVRRFHQINHRHEKCQTDEKNDFFCHQTKSLKITKPRRRQKVGMSSTRKYPRSGFTVISGCL
jgi:hypothetical protein